MDQFSKMQQYQKVNHFCGDFSFSQKNYLGLNLQKMKAQFPISYSFFPLTWILPSQYLELMEYADSCSSKKLYIIKPEASSQGRGIHLT